ncbi:DUF4386 domain-containing protein [Actinotalea sp. M2MS4P-6]|uniref:DUF4386 domain-containing protein n=1 Tax=Actinotalea sp. M2MS4P-6 TaxID=2983762 RepID=UPI0021E50B4A|nr:DUF4386 domain-containing protein [Actinotalea sp. M2MS4P-6]MCV2395158.1 DUF4386 domain-containing protein [Actinotalea sp. M2MS4P-6]
MQSRASTSQDQRVVVSEGRSANREERTAAVAVGLLYIVATVAGLVAASIGAPTEPTAMAADRGAVLGSALAVTVMACSVIGVAVMLYPVLSRDATSTLRRGMATGYLASRIAEGTLFLVGVVVVLAMLTLGEDAASAGDAGAVGTALQAVNEYSAVIGQTVFGVGALLLYRLLYVSGRIPAWLALWGLIAAPLFLVSGATLPFTHDPNSTISSVLYAPLAVQEMVMAFWLVVLGFRPVRAAAAR